MTGLLPWIGVGAMGAAGALARFKVAAAITAARPSAFPWGTFAVNMTGGFVLGALVGAGVGADALFVVGTGFLGGYTTFSTWMVEAQRLGEDGDVVRLLLYLLGSMIAGLAAARLGWWITEALV
jgi:fluoride exporter